MRININTILTPDSIVETLHRQNKTMDIMYIVIDVLRASTTICSALFNGAKEIIPCETIKEAKDVKKILFKENVLLCGERHGIKPKGFDLGNSPAEFTGERIANKTIIMTTSNCTKTLTKLKNFRNVLIGCFSNFTAVVDLIVSTPKANFKEIVFVCAGDDGKESLEDTVCAGAYIYNIINRYDNCYLSEESKYALDTYLKSRTKLKEAFYNSVHGRELRNIGFQSDIDLGMKFDIFPVVHVYKNGRIIPHANNYEL
jgi:2-phosphosulfolactate phosphatase